MASRVERIEITQAEFDKIFGSSDSETENNSGEGSDLDFQGLDDENSSSESGESDNEHEEENGDQLAWSSELTNIVVDDFVSPTGITFDIAENAERIDIFLELFGDEILNKIVTESNCYARQKLAEHAEQRSKYVDVTFPELKGYLGVCILMGINSLPCIADYWSSNTYLGNDKGYDKEPF